MPTRARNFLNMLTAYDNLGVRSLFVVAPNPTISLDRSISIGGFFSVSKSEDSEHVVIWSDEHPVVDWRPIYVARNAQMHSA